MQPLGRMGLQTESHKQKERVFKTKSSLFNRSGNHTSSAPGSKMTKNNQIPVYDSPCLFRFPAGEQISFSLKFMLMVSIVFSWIIEGSLLDK